jgi:hypothetical protein
VLRESEDEENKLGEAISRIQRFVHFVIQSIARLFRRTKERQATNDTHNNIEQAVALNQVC